jgi:hypothetical protein
MAQDVEKKMPDAVGVMGGYKTVDYGKVANENAKHRATGGGVWEPGAYNLGGREHHSAGNAVGGSQMLVDPTDWAALVQAHAQMTNPYGASGANKMGTPGATGVVPAANLAVPKLVQANAPQMKQGSSLHDAVQTGKDVASLAQSGSDLKKLAEKQLADKPKPDAKPDATSKADLPSAKANPVSLESQSGDSSGFKIPEGNTLPSSNNVGEELTPPDATPDLEGFFAYGGVVPRNHFDTGGYSDPYKLPDPTGEQLPSDTLKASEESKDESEREAPKPGKTGGGGGDSTMSDIGAAASIFGTAAKILPFFLASGGVVPREHHADGDKVGDGGGSDDSAPEAPASRQYMTYLTDKKGYSPTAAAAIIGNAYHESGGLNPEILGDSGKSLGLFQFHQAGEQPAFRQWASENKRDVKNPYAQIDFVDSQLRGPYLSVLDKMNNASSASEASSHFMRGYERPKEGQTAGENARASFAETLAGGKDLPNGMRNLGQSFAGPQPEKSTNRRGSSLGDVFEEMTSDAIPSNSNFWIPALSALATAAASRAPTRGQALAEGVLGGVAGYQQNIKQQAELAKGVMDLVKDRFVVGYDSTSGQQTLFDKMSKQYVDPNAMRATVAGMLKARGIDPKAYGYDTAQTGASSSGGGGGNEPMTVVKGPVQQPAATGTAQPAGQPTTQPMEANQSGQTSKPEAIKMQAQGINAIPFNATTNQAIDYALQHPSEFGLDNPERNVPQMLSEYKRLMAAANAASTQGAPADVVRNLQEQANQQRTMAMNIAEKAVDVAITRNNDAVKNDITSASNFESESSKRMASYQPIRSELVRMGHILEDYKSGRGAEALADLGGVAQRLGISSSDIAKNSANFDELYKLSMQQALGAMSENGFQRAPKTMADKELATVPSASIQPGAAYALLGRKIGEMDWLNARDNEYIKNHRQTPPSQFMQNWNQNPQSKIEPYIRNAFHNDVPAGTGVTAEDINSQRRTWGEYTPPNIRQKQQQQQSQMPSVKNDADYNSIQSGQSYVAPDGSVRVKR